MSAAYRRTAWAGGLLGLITAGIVFAPAHWLGSAVAKATGQRLQWPNAQGTVWQGQADLLITAGPGSSDRSRIPGGLRWSLRPSWHHGPGMALQVWLPCCATEPLQLQAGLGTSGVQWQASAHESRWSAQWLSGLGTPWNTLQLQGQLVLKSEPWQGQVALNRATASGALQMQALDLSTRLSTLRPVGSYELRINSDTSSSQLELSTLSGDLLLKGQGRWVGGSLRFAGEASASPEREAALANLLNIIGRRQGARSVIQIG